MSYSTLYIDIENLQDIAKKVILSAIGHWPEGFPRPDTIKLYVRADQTELWTIWANHNMPSIEFQVKGVQHYTYTGSKNAADLSLALEAISDLLKARTKYISVLSDDSDFASLFSAVKQEIGFDDSNLMVPFKWLMTGRSDTRSQVLIDFFPPEYIHVVSSSPAASPVSPFTSTPPPPPPPAPAPSPVAPPAPAVPTPAAPAAEKSVQKEAPPQVSYSEDESIARTIIKNLPVGPFKSADCKKIILESFPRCNLNKGDNASYGTKFSKFIWPILERYGVLLPNPNRKPRKYEMTEEAKRNVDKS